MKKTATPRFSPKTLLFLNKARRQKRPDWLVKSRPEYEELIINPLQHLASHLKRELAPVASGYHFPQKGIGRMKRAAHRAKEYGSLYKSYVSYTASRPAESRFERNPSLFFLINPEDKDDSVLIAGGLYMPSSRQVRAIREAIAENASAFDRLFASKDFARSFPEGFSDERISSRVPRGFDAGHARISWIQLQAFFVWRSYKKREFASPGFAEIVARDCRQILRLNELLDAAIQGRLPKASVPLKKKSTTSTDHLAEIEAPQREMDF
jgi:uncharacterized protein (TIGR02453 family)